MLALSLAFAPALAASVQAAPQAADARPVAGVNEDELILYALQLDELTLSEGLAAYGDPAEPFLPLGEIARLLELDLRLAPSAGRATGSIGEARAPLLLDVPTGVARAGGKQVTVAPEQVRVTPTEIYVAPALLQALLPVEVTVDAEALAVVLRPTTKLPVQSRLERAARLRTLGSSVGEGNDDVLHIEAPYELVSPPAFDVILEAGNDTRGSGFTTRYDLRAAGDLLYTGFQAFVGSDEKGRPSEARLLFERRSREGTLLGPLKATRVSAGDVFTPVLALGPRSVAGRGFFLSTVPLEQASVFETVDLRGELPIGFDVELYVNDVLRSGQRAPVQGRYEFLDVPLVRGINIIRIVSYGPQGDRSEQVRVLNVGSGQLASGRTTLELGVVEQERPLISLRSPAISLPGLAEGKLRAVASVAHGLTEALTVVGGASLYPTASGERRDLVTAGVRTSLFGLSANADAALDRRGGFAAGFGLAGQPLGVSTVLSHAEYRRGFVDENQLSGDPRRRLARNSEVTLDFTLPVLKSQAVPLSLRLLRDGYADGGSSWVASTRASTRIYNTLVSGGLDYQRLSVPVPPPLGEVVAGIRAKGAARRFTTDERLGGMFAASRFIDYKWQFRAVVDYDLLPAADFRSVAFTADRALTDRLALRFGVGQFLRAPRSTNLQAGATLRLPFADLAFNADYSAPRKDWSVGLRLAFGIGYDRGAGRYRMTSPGPATGGSALFRSFLDANGNGRFDKGEAPVAGVGIEGGERKQVTGASGRAFLVGLGTAPSGRLQANTDQVENFYVTTPPRTIEYSPRAGKVLSIDYPLTPAGEVYARLLLRQGGAPVGLSAVRIRLLRQNGEEAKTGATEFDGSIVFTDVAIGEYRLELDPVQAQQLGMRLAKPVTVRISGDVSAPPEVVAEVVFEGAAEPAVQDEEAGDAL
jgi:hypothetical protein